MLHLPHILHSLCNQHG